MPLSDHVVFPTRSRREVGPVQVVTAEKGSVSGASKSVFQACTDFASGQRFLGTATLWI